MAPRFDRVLLNHIEKQNNEIARLILKQADDPYHMVDSFGNTLLHYAARHGNLDMTKYLIECGSSIDAQNKDGKTPLILAMEHHGTIQVAEVLLDANADINVRDTDDNSPIYLAANADLSFGLLRKCFKKLEIQCSYDYEEIATLLLDGGCNLVHAMYLGHDDITRIMLKRGRGCDDVAFFMGVVTPLHLAVRFMHLENVKLLLQHGADVNLFVGRAAPVFDLDVTHKDANLVLEILKTLLEAGARMHIEKWNTDYMQMSMHLRKGTKDVIRLLMKYDFDLNKICNSCTTVLHELAYNEKPGVFAELRHKRFDVDAPNSGEFTPLWVAMHNPSSVKFLLERGADPDAGNGRDKILTVLMKPFGYAGTERARVHLESVELLLQYGANVEIVDRNGMTIFDIAVKYEGGEKYIKPVLAHLAMIEARGYPIPALANERIRAHELLQRGFDFYAQQVENMKTITVCQSITLHNLLTDSFDKIIAYMRNEDLVLKLSRLSSKCGLTSYYHKCLRLRLTRAMVIAKLKEGAAIVLSKMIGLNYGANSVIIDKIVHYLDYEDLLELHYVYE